MAADLSTIIQIHKLCGCEEIDADTVQVSQVCLSTDPTISNLSEFGEQIEVRHVTAAPDADYGDLNEGNDPVLEAMIGLTSSNTKTYSFGTAKAVVYDDGSNAYLGYIENSKTDNGDMRDCLKKLFKKLLDEGKILFYFRMTTLYPQAIDTIEGDFTIDVIDTHQLYVR